MLEYDQNIYRKCEKEITNSIIIYPDAVCIRKRKGKWECIRVYNSWISKDNNRFQRINKHAIPRIKTLKKREKTRDYCNKNCIFKEDQRGKRREGKDKGLER